MFLIPSLSSSTFDNLNDGSGCISQFNARLINKSTTPFPNPNFGSYCLHGLTRAIQKSELNTLYLHLPFTLSESPNTSLHHTIHCLHKPNISSHQNYATMTDPTPVTTTNALPAATPPPVIRTPVDPFLNTPPAPGVIHATPTSVANPPPIIVAPTDPLPHVPPAPGVIHKPVISSANPRLASSLLLPVLSVLLPPTHAARSLYSKPTPMLSSLKLQVPQLRRLIWSSALILPPRLHARKP